MNRIVKKLKIITISMKQRIDTYLSKHNLVTTLLMTLLTGAMCIIIICVGIYIFSSDSYDKLSFLGSVFGGGITFIGVWLTLFNQSINRKKELSIQFKPHLEITGQTAKINKNTFINGICGIILSENCNKQRIITLSIKNNGMGECLLHSLNKIECNDFKYNNEILSSKNYNNRKLIESVNAIIDENWSVVLPVNSTIIINVMIAYEKSNIDIVNDLTLTIPFEYTDQFKYSRYNAKTTLKFNVTKGKIKRKDIKLIYMNIKNDKIGDFN